jgi:hypothetical protein
MEEQHIDHVIWEQRNKGNFKLSIVARLKGPMVSNIQYIIRLKDPQDMTIDFLTTLDGFREMGELFQALHHFCKRPIYANERDMKKLKELLTPENIKNFAEFLKMSKSGK